GRSRGRRRAAHAQGSREGAEAPTRLLAALPGGRGRPLVAHPRTAARADAFRTVRAGGGGQGMAGVARRLSGVRGGGEATKLRALNAPRPARVGTDAAGAPVWVLQGRRRLRVEGVRETWRIDD